MSETPTTDDASARRLPARRPQFDLDSTPRVWVPGHPGITHIINVLHLLLPAGELWFCRLYAKVLPTLEEGPLREDVRGFMRQEALHSRAHDRVLTHLEAQGIDTKSFTRLVTWLFDVLLGEHAWLTRLPLVGGVIERWWLRQRVTIVAAIEHFTCVLGRWIVEEGGDSLERAGADPAMLALLRWHGAEEVEHRTVAHDLHLHLSGSYVMRILWMLVVSSVLFGIWVHAARFLMRQEPSLARFRGFFAEWNDAAKAGLLPTPAVLFSAVLRYLRRGYDPEDEATMERAQAYLVPRPAA